VAALAAAALAVLAAAPAALGHATLETTKPADDSVVEESPAQVVLRYDEPVESALGAVRVYDGEGRQVDSEEIARPAPESVAVPIDRRLARGTYTVAWRVISADSDPIQGAFVFHVEEPGPAPAGIAAEVLEDTPPLTSVLYATGRGIDYALLLLCVGGTAVLALALAPASIPLRRRLLRILGWLGVALAVVALAGIALQAAAGAGLPISEALRWEGISSVIDTRFGRFSLLRAGLALVIGLLAFWLSRSAGPPHRATWAVAGVAAVALIVTPVASGHASISGTIPFIADLAHVQAAAIWVGGLGFLTLGLVLAGGDRWPLAARAVPRFSTMALVAVGILVAGGAINGIHQVGAWRGLWDTTYGLLLLAKIALILPLLGLGLYNNRFAVPRLRAGLASLVERRRFLRAVATELVLMAAIVGVTAVLVNAPPARTEVVHEMAAHELELGPLDAHVTVEPGTAGDNEVRLGVMEEGEPAEVDELRLSAALPSSDIGPLKLKPRPAGGHGEYFADAELPIAGEWQLRAEARRGKFDLFTGTTSIEIRQE
jgi:copper transport protein